MEGRVEKVRGVKVSEQLTTFLTGLAMPHPCLNTSCHPLPVHGPLWKEGMGQRIGEAL